MIHVVVLFEFFDYTAEIVTGYATKSLMYSLVGWLVGLHLLQQ